MPFSVKDYANSSKCRKMKIIQYFDTDSDTENLAVQNCGFCDVCVSNNVYPELANISPIGEERKRTLNEDRVAVRYKTIREQRDTLIKSFAPEQIDAFIQNLDSNEKEYVHNSLARILESSPSPSAYLMRAFIDTNLDENNAIRNFELALEYINPIEQKENLFKVLEYVGKINSNKKNEVLEKVISSNPNVRDDSDFVDYFYKNQPKGYAKKYKLYHYMQFINTILEDNKYEDSY